jgi:hypothetical protein
VSYILNYSNWKKVFEQDAASGLSDVKDKTAFTGATLSNAPNADALAEMKSGLPNVKIIGDKQEITENDAIAKVSDTGTSNWKIVPKTVKAKDYLKIGDLVLNGDSKKAVTIKLPISDLAIKPIEAAGNGIFALSRALLLKYGELKNFPQTPLIIGLNTKTANSFITNANTAFQGPIGDFTYSGLTIFMLSNAITSNANNTTNNVSVLRNIAAKGTMDASEMASDGIMPQIPKANWESVKSVSPIDFNAFIAKIKDKRISTFTPELQKYIEEYVNTFFDQFLTTYSERFKSFLSESAANAGISSTMFQELFDYINAWKTDQASKKEEYKADLIREIKEALQPLQNRGSVSRPAATASGKVVSGTEGKIGQ